MFPLNFILFCFAAIVIRVEAAANPEIVMTKISKAHLRHPPQNIRLEMVIPDQALLKAILNRVSIKFSLFIH